jgi:uncharacterized protein involved in response to NO
MSSLLQIEVASRRPRPPSPTSEPGAGHPLWRLGFRPFYLVASIFAAVSVVLWMLQVTGHVRIETTLPGPLWHAHEMLFGFTLAVVVGFLFTAGRNWSGRATPTGGWLAALVLLWLAARILGLTPYGWAAAATNVAFPLACSWGLARALVGAGNRRNYFFIGLLVLMGLASLGIHVSVLGAASFPAWVGMQVAIDVVLFMMVVIGGRVIPMFTNNGVPGAQAARMPVVERASLMVVLAVLAADVGMAAGPLFALLLAIAAFAHMIRWMLWQPWRTLRTPLVWVLHGAYLWIPLHLALRAAAEAGFVDRSLATHALTLGAIGGLTIGMMTRTARGHTGRPLKADRADVWCYGLVLGAAAIRVFGPMLFPAGYLAWVSLSAAAWSAGFALFAWRYWPVLSRPRLDGQPG